MQLVRIPLLDGDRMEKRQESEKRGEMLQYSILSDTSLLIVTPRQFLFHRQLVQRSLIRHEHLFVAAHGTAGGKQSAFTNALHIQQQHTGIEIVMAKDIAEEPLTVPIRHAGDLKGIHLQIIQGVKRRAAHYICIQIKHAIRNFRHAIGKEPQHAKRREPGAHVGKRQIVVKLPTDVDASDAAARMGILQSRLQAFFKRCRNRRMIPRIRSQNKHVQRALCLPGE